MTKEKMREAESSPILNHQGTENTDNSPPLCGINQFMHQVGYLFDERYLLHDPGSRHAESPQRLLAIRQALESFGAEERWQRIEFCPAHLDELSLVHHSSLIERVEWASNHAPVQTDGIVAIPMESGDSAACPRVPDEK